MLRHLAHNFVVLGVLYCTGSTGLLVLRGGCGAVFLTVLLENDFGQMLSARALYLLGSLLLLLEALVFYLF